ncbi:hypothetical protein [Ekhidna sp.]|uniref:hypothetical protein n=1 Tax=Ekhidna sp. TaxID=2608089 RepID=UPI003C7E6D79
MKKLFFVLFLIPATVWCQYTAKSTMYANGKKIIVTNWVRGYVELVGGIRKEGEIQLKVVDSDTVEVRVKPNGGKKEKYLREEVDKFYGVVLISDVKNDYNKPFKNFHPGKIYFSTGEERVGKVAGMTRDAHEIDGSKIYGPAGVKFANERDEVAIYKAISSDVVYYIQTIDGSDNHYICVGRQYIQVGNPTGRFSYFQNPSPTHVRDGATHLVKSSIESVKEELAEEAAEAAAKKSIEESQKRGEDIGTSIGNATVAAMNASSMVNEALTPDPDGAIYFEEYYIVDNETGTRSVIYKKNVDEVLSELLEGCGVDDQISDVTNGIKDLTEVMVFLEENACD